MGFEQFDSTDGGRPDAGRNRWEQGWEEADRHRRSDEEGADGEPASRSGPRAAADRDDRRIRLPPGLVARLDGARLRLGPRHVAVIVVVSLAVIGWSIWSLHRSAAGAIPSVYGDAASPVSVVAAVSRSPVGPAGSGSSIASVSPIRVTAAATPSVVGPLIVDVVGKVRSPGLVRLPAGARVGDALLRAGGALPGVDLTDLNLARRVVDGEQIAVGVRIPPSSSNPATSSPGGVGPPLVGSSVGPSNAAPGTATAVVDLNTADATQLDALPGVGPVMAQRIIDWRTQHGRFGTVDDLQEVQGIGPKKFAQLRPHVRV